MSWTLLLFVAYLALLVWAMRSRTRELKGPWWFFLRAFFPNWKFYHSVGRPPRLYVKGRLPDGSWTGNCSTPGMGENFGTCFTTRA